ncbi:MAG: thiamine pyrophosphate-dependent dehydrogenase E1 component subunit alpha [Hyphomicrobiaceae bacterium]|nr:thiamine pyrophosphate-dependent dehydrogenase E1 component subunit alpha [Hyphomicrobiaceae bacterium]
MQLIRRFEITCNELYMQGKIPSTLHLCTGQEAVPTGVSFHLRASDYVFGTHRPHGHALAKGVRAEHILAELYGKATGSCKGKGGSMHVGDMAVSMPPAIAIVGGNVPLAAGTALAQKMRRLDDVTVCYFGEGAANEGAWHEAVNAAALWSLPVIFVCENNLYAASTPFETAFRVRHVADRADAYGMPSEIVDGNAVLDVVAAAGRAVARARAGEGPTMLECLTYRQAGHSRSDPRTYRTKEEEAEWAERDPIARFTALLLADGRVTQGDIDAASAAVEDEIAAAIAFAESSPEPDPADALTDVFKD